jgi:hypothetical protein
MALSRYVAAKVNKSADSNKKTNGWKKQDQYAVPQGFSTRRAGGSG